MLPQIFPTPVPDLTQFKLINQRSKLPVMIRMKAARAAFPQMPTIMMLTRRNSFTSLVGCRRQGDNAASTPN